LRPLRRCLRQYLDGGTHNNVGTGMTGHGAANEQQTTLAIDADDVQILYGALNASHMTGHFLAGEHATWVLGLTHGAGDTVRARVTVGGALGAEVVTLDCAGEPFTYGDTGDINLLPFFEDAFDSQSCTRLKLGKLLGSYAELFENAASFDASFGKVTCQRL